MLRKAALSALLVLGVLANPRDRPNAYYSLESVVVDRPVAEVFQFVQREIPSVYTRMSPMHQKFEILNAEALVEGAEVDCVEGDEKEVVRNHYVVTRVVENRLIAMASTPTRVHDRASGELVAEVDVWDYFDFEALAPDRTRLTQTVVLDMKSPFVKSAVDVAAFLSGTRGDWERQFQEQLQNLASFIEERRLVP